MISRFFCIFSLFVASFDLCAASANSCPDLFAQHGIPREVREGERLVGKSLGKLEQTQLDVLDLHKRFVRIRREALLTEASLTESQLIETADLERRIIQLIGFLGDDTSVEYLIDMFNSQIDTYNSQDPSLSLVIPFALIDAISIRGGDKAKQFLEELASNAENELLVAYVKIRLPNKNPFPQL